MRNFNYELINIKDLCVNPENYRYVDEVQDEITAIIAMFNVPSGDPKKEMVNLAKDIMEDGLNPFEMPIVCYDDDVNKYVVYDGNRRITCLKLMTQYKKNEEILRSVPTVAEIFKLEYKGEEAIQCVVYDEVDDAIHFLNKIHNDVNNGIGRKQWDSHAKMKANAANGNRSKSYAIVEFIKSNSNSDPQLLNLMSTKRWISKLERVVSFAKFKEVYNIHFDNNSNMSYSDTEEQVLKMMSKLVFDIINNSATDNFRFKKDFEQYIIKLPNEYKTQVSVKQKDESKARNGNMCEDSNKKNNNDDKGEAKDEKHSKVEPNNTSNRGMNFKGTGRPKPIRKKYAYTTESLVLGKTYQNEDYFCLDEKGREFLIEMESLNIREYPFAVAALCRCLLEYILKQWLDEYGGTFNSKMLPSTYKGCVNLLFIKKVINSKENSVLNAQINKEDYLTLLNTWIHSDTSACVSLDNLTSGWNNVRLLIEKYIDTHKS